MSYLLDVPDAVTIQYQEGEELVPGTQSVSLKVILLLYQNITEETVIKAQPSGSKEGKKCKKIGNKYKRGLMWTIMKGL